MTPQLLPLQWDVGMQKSTYAWESSGSNADIDVVLPWTPNIYRTVKLKIYCHLDQLDWVCLNDILAMNTFFRLCNKRKTCTLLTTTDFQNSGDPKPIM